MLGADLSQITQILLNTTAKQILIAALIGIPTAHYVIQQYLKKYSDRIELQWWHFTLPLVILIVVMSSTIASVVWKAAMSNPVDALKHEEKDNIGYYLLQYKGPQIDSSALV